MNEASISRAVDHFADAKQFAEEAQHEARRGNSTEAERFAALARQSALIGAHELMGPDERAHTWTVQGHGI